MLNPKHWITPTAWLVLYSVCVNRVRQYRVVIMCLFSFRWLPPVALFPTWYVCAHKMNINIAQTQTVKEGQACYCLVFSFLILARLHQIYNTEAERLHTKVWIKRNNLKKFSLDLPVAWLCGGGGNCLSVIRSKSVDQMMEHVMERHYHFDLTYITERIISVFFLPDLEEQQYCRNLQEVASMLKSKHQDKFLVSRNAEKTPNRGVLNWSTHLAHFVNHTVNIKWQIVPLKMLLILEFTHNNRSFFLSFFLSQLLNLSEKRHDITRLSPKVLLFTSTREAGTSLNALVAKKQHRHKKKTSLCLPSGCFFF